MSHKEVKEESVSTRMTHKINIDVSTTCERSLEAISTAAEVDSERIIFMVTVPKPYINFPSLIKCMIQPFC